MAGSVAFGQATVIKEGVNLTTYIYAMSIMVADANGNAAPAGTAVNLSLRPIAWSAGTGCTVDADTATTGTFYYEDANENLTLDTNTVPPEDGAGVYYFGGLASTTGTVDAKITPPNSYSSTIPATVYTNASGVATFDLEYPKTSAIWIVDRIRATTTVQGSDAVGEMQF